MIRRTFAVMSSITIARWLYLCCFMIFMMAVIGAITRLTESGLSITEWKPVSGAMPPLDEAAWQHEFDLYRQSPEFAARHFWMELEDFKKIFFWEWLHRLWGRTIGLVYALPLLWFWAQKKIPAGYGWPFLGLLALGGLQGFVGWFMVKSGLSDRPDVSHFRLATHLGLALFIYGCTLWLALGLSPSHPVTARNHGKFLRAHGWTALLMLGVTIVWGAFVAGLDAGMIYNTFPKMNAGWMPEEPFSGLAPAVAPAWVQFTHRWLATATGLIILAYAARTRSWALAGMVVVQIGLGISTLVSQVWLPLAAAHQAGAIVLLSLLIVSLRKTMRKKCA